MKFISNWIILFVTIASIGGVLMTTAMPQTALAAACDDSKFLGFPAWHRGLAGGADCSINSPTSDNLSNFIWHIALNILEAALMAVAYIAAFFILYGGFKFITSRGSPDDTAKAKTSILNAIIGLVIAISATAIVNFIAGGL